MHIIINFNNVQNYGFMQSRPGVDLKGSVPERAKKFEIFVGGSHEQPTMAKRTLAAEKKFVLC